MSTRFVIKWGKWGYVHRRFPANVGYVSVSTSPECKQWKSEANAQRWLNCKDPGYREQCVIVPITCYYEEEDFTKGRDVA